MCCFGLQKSQKTCTCPSFQYFSLSWNRTQVAQNSCVPTKNGRKICGMMGNLMADRRRSKGPTVRTGGSPLPRLPPARRGVSHEDGRTHPIPQHARGGDGQPCVRRLPQDRQVVHLTQGKAHRGLLGRTVTKLWLPNSMWNRTESYCNVLNRMIAACACRTFVV
mgnify:CR=1 FL=1